MDMIDLKGCVKWLQSNSYKRICLQVPCHLLHQSPNLSLNLQRRLNAKIFIIDDSLFQNYCNDQFTMEYIKSDASICVGHACLNCSNPSRFHIFPNQIIDLNIFYDQFYKYFQEKSKGIVLFYDTIFVNIIETIYETLKIKYKHLDLSRLHCNSNDNFTTCTRECNINVLGRCYNSTSNCGSDIRDAVFLGMNRKTLMALSMSIPLKVWHYYDGFQFYEYDLLNSLWFKRRFFLIEKIKEAYTFGIIITSINAEDYLKVTEMISYILKQAGKKVYRFSIEKMNPSILASFQEIDIFVAVACPEKILEETNSYYKPIVTPFEVDLAFNAARTFSKFYAIDFQQMLPDGLQHKTFKLKLKTDVSLISGKVINYAQSIAESKRDLICKGSAEVLENEFQSDFLTFRNWKGLQQKLGKGEINFIVAGRDGIPVNYINENS